MKLVAQMFDTAWRWAIRIALLLAVYQYFQLPGLVIATYLLLSWQSYRSAETKPSLSTWTHDDDDAHFAIDFKTMIANQRIRDLGPLARQSLIEEWDEEDKEYKLRGELHSLIDIYGWTKEAWLDQHAHEFQVRRKEDAIWEMRLTHKYWARRNTELVAILKAPFHIGQMYAEEEFEKLLGFTWKQELNRDSEPIPPGDHRPWQRVGDWVEASIETAYQRFVHQG
jgi:hypothetical protein